MALGHQMAGDTSRFPGWGSSLDTYQFQHSRIRCIHSMLPSCAAWPLSLSYLAPEHLRFSVNLREKRDPSEGRLQGRNCRRAGPRGKTLIPL
ncbi:hypothetical protein Y1Q_0002249 [Alligator mississippiensis]|uniref:Uncharacterized protein n=1 Tax=Alligator mississippiensis TaxID=8496 RepID=A0A151MGH5_ALLMI|nr:hypothetical protein Y1Q_0002249 [Alligator mississippiensis]